jgi:hypothetical protein
VAVTGVLAAAFAGLVTVGAGLAAEVLAVLLDVVAFTDFALAVRAGAFGGGVGAHRHDI